MPLPFWDSALPAAVFAAFDELGLRRTLLAAFAAVELVCRLFFAMMYLGFMMIRKGLGVPSEPSNRRAHLILDA